MAQTYNQTATAGPSAGQYCTGNATANGAAWSKQASVGGSSGAEATITVDGSLTTGRAVYYKCIIPSGTNWDAGDWTINVNVTTAAANTTIEQCHVCRVNSSDVNQQTLGSATGLGIAVSATGVKTITVNQGSAATPSVGDNVIIVLALTNANSCTRTLGITPDQTITNAYTDAATTITPSNGTATLTGFVAGLALALTTSVGAATLTGYAPTVTMGISPDVGSVTLTGYAPTVEEIVTAIDVPDIAMMAYRPAGFGVK